MSSTEDYEELILDQVIENNLSNVAPSELDVSISNSLEIVSIVPTTVRFSRIFVLITNLNPTIFIFAFK